MASLAFSASSLVAFSRTGLGAPSTSSLASLRPRLVRVRTSLMTLIFFSPALVRTTSNSSFSSAAPAPPPPAAGPPRRRPREPRRHAELLLEAFSSSLSSRTDMLAMASRISSWCGHGLALLRSCRPTRPVGRCRCRQRRWLCGALGGVGLGLGSSACRPGPRQRLSLGASGGASSGRGGHRRGRRERHPGR